VKQEYSAPQLNIIILHVFSKAEIHMDSYVIRIYRRDDKNPGKAAGQVEFVEQGHVKSFTCVDELVNILGLKEKRTPRNRSKKSIAVQASNKQVRKKP
jgi:hypothetical protein